MEEMETIRAGSRASRLAKVQVKEIFALLARAGWKVDYEAVTFDTSGDKDRTTSLTTNPADDFFTDTLDEALLKGEIDIAIHSAKDLPKLLAKGLDIIALTESIDDTDAFIGRAKFSDLPAGAKIGTSSLVRQQGVRELRPDLAAVDIRGNIEDRIRQFKEGKFDAIIVAACALKRLGLEKEITEILPWEAAPLQGQLAVVAHSMNYELKRLFAKIDVRRRYGKVRLVGAGPGDPDLLTLKGMKALREVDVIFYDYLAHPDLLDYAPQAQKIYVGKRKGEHSLAQEDLNKKIRDAAMAGKNVVRLKGGDPLVFGRGAEEIEYVSAYHIRVEVVPGVSSATGLPSELGVPLTARGISSSVAFVSAHGEAEEKGEAAPIHIPDCETIVFFMGLTKLKEIVGALKAAGRPENFPMLLISRGSRLEEKVVCGTLADIEGRVGEEPLQPPVLIVAGKTVEFWPQISHRIFHRSDHVLYLGTNPEPYKFLGHIIHHPMIEVNPVAADHAFCENLRREVEQSEIILLTSRCAVRSFFALAKSCGIHPSTLRRKDLAVIGRASAEALSHEGFLPAVTARDETSEGMFAALKENFDLKGRRVLFPRSSLPNPYLKTEMAKLGAQVVEVTVYTNTKPPKKPLPQIPVDKVVFSSPSTLDNFLKDYGRIPEGWGVLCKGIRTWKSLREAGYDGEILES